ncbi:hypothetical protein LWI29_035280 [Acer saccharum]|uniref:Rapid ALkalinization Factor n=1 Tax=Acer saccharum TaxID=4024 RepID=A0AA39T0T0_ACESA|nr:hypothetical protein LWI29_035280 [Acer saccharum]
MGSSSSSCTVLVICAMLAMMMMSCSISTVDASGDYNNHLGWIPNGSLVGDLEEFDMMDNEINRRILATTKYISYGALQRNTVPCSRRGASYYNCKNGAQANPYSRGCSQITRCRG